MSKKPAKKGTKSSQKKAVPSAKAAPKGAKTDPKPAVVEGTNILTDDQQRAIFLNHCTMLEGVTKKKASVEAVIKAEGGDLKLVRKALKLLASEDRPAEKVIAAEKAAKTEIEQTLRIARWVGSDLGVAQIDWLEGVTPAVDRAFDEGKMAGLRAQPRKPPYDSSVPQYTRWFEGYDEGRAVLKTKFRPPSVGAAEPKAAPKASTKGGTGSSPGSNDLIFDEGAKGDKTKAQQTKKNGTKAPDAPAAPDKPASTAPAENAKPSEGKKTLPEPEFYDSKDQPKTPTPPPPPEDGEPAETDLKMGGPGS